MRLILDGAHAGLVQQALFRYRLRPGSLSSDEVRSLRERVGLLDKAANDPSLGSGERQAWASARRTANSRALAAEAREALLKRDTDARRRSLAMAAARGVPLRARMLAAGAALMPGLGGRVLGRQADAASSARGRRAAQRSG